MSQSWKLVLLLVGIFIAGAVTGGFATLRLAHRFLARPPSPEQWGGARLKKLSGRLDLTAEQEGKLQPIMQRDMADLARIRDGAFADSKRIFERMDHDIAELLTPEQRVKFEQMNREMREHLQRFMKEHPFGPHRDHGHPGADMPPSPPPPPEKPPGTP